LNPLGAVPPLTHAGADVRLRILNKLYATSAKFEHLTTHAPPWLEAKRAGVMVVHLTGPINRRLPHLRYTTPSQGIEVADFRYQPTRWCRAYRFVVIRRSQPAERPSR
jgi:hypothetical protein